MMASQDMLRKLAADAVRQNGCRIETAFGWEPSRRIGRIDYHHSKLWTAEANLYGFSGTAKVLRGDTSSAREVHLWKLYTFYYWEEQLNLDTLALNGRPGSYLEGLAILERVSSRELEHSVCVWQLRGRGGALRRRSALWSPAARYCDWRALERTLLAACARGWDTSSLEARATEAMLLASLPEVAYTEKRQPYRMAPLYSQRWLALLEQAAAWRNRYPILAPLADCSAEPSALWNALLAEGGDFYAGLALRLLLCGKNPEGACLLRDEAAAHRLREAVAAYKSHCTAFIRGSGGVYASAYLLDNRLATERTLREIAALEERLPGTNPFVSGESHPL